MIDDLNRITLQFIMQKDQCVSVAIVLVITKAPVPVRSFSVRFVCIT